MTDVVPPKKFGRPVKLSFQLTEDQAGPLPVSVESLWCDTEGANFRVKNIPFFIDGISFNDLISVREVSEDLVQVDTVIQPSHNSTIWLYLKDESEGAVALEALRTLGCGVEGGVLNGYFAVNVPARVEINDVYSIINRAESLGFVTSDYPSIRHESKP